MGTEPQELFGAGGWSARLARARGATAYVLEEQHPSGEDRWIQLRRYASKLDAEAALEETRKLQSNASRTIRIRRIKSQAQR